MHHSASLVDYIESAIDRSPYCACGAGMTAVEHDGSLWLECIRHDEQHRGVVARLWALVGHDRQLLLAADEAA